MDGLRWRSGRSQKGGKDCLDARMEVLTERRRQEEEGRGEEVYGCGERQEESMRGRRKSLGGSWDRDNDSHEVPTSTRAGSTSFMLATRSCL